MKEAIEYVEGNIVGIIIAVAIVLIVIGVIGGVIDNEKTWNDGYCQCGGKWEYVESRQTISGTKESIHTYNSYIYKCNSCGRMHAFRILR